jgi:hypothetical protein
MRKSSGLFVAVLALFFTVNATAQDFTDAHALVKAAYEKSGGDKWKSVESMVMSSSMTIDSPQGEMMGTAKLTFLYPGYMHARILLDMDDGSGMPMGPITQVMTPDSGYVQMDQGTQALPGGGAPDAASDELEMLQDEGPMLSMEIYELNGTEVYKVTATTDEETTSHYYDKTTLMKVAKATDTPAGTNWTYYDDYKDVDGLMVAYKMTQNMMGGMKQVLTMKSIEVNAELDRAKLFGDM